VLRGHAVNKFQHKNKNKNKKPTKKPMHLWIEQPRAKDTKHTQSNRAAAVQVQHDRFQTKAPGVLANGRLGAW
jgi:hypothetical protein